jgi:hypothetical protein
MSFVTFNHGASKKLNTPKKIPNNCGDTLGNMPRPALIVSCWLTPLSQGFFIFKQPVTPLENASK